MILLRRFFLTAGLLFTVAVFSCGEAAPQQAVITIDANQKFQTISGWEATAQAGESYSARFADYQSKLFDQAVYELGINRLRLEIRSGAENPTDFFRQFENGKINEQQWRAHYYEVINDNDDPLAINAAGFSFSELDSTTEKVVLPMKKRLEERGERLFVNLTYIDFADWRGKSNIRHKTDAEEYAEFMLAAFRHLQKKYDFTPDAIEVILEPDQNTGWTGADIGRVVVAAAKRLRAENFKPYFIVPATASAANAPIYIDEIAKIEVAMNYIGEFSYHRYRDASADVIKSIAERGAKYGKQTAMLEKIGADYENLHEDLKIGNNSAWQQYTLAFPNEPDNGAQYFLVNDKSPKNPVVTIGEQTKFLQQYFKRVRAGARRIGAETSNQNFDPLAFINKNGRYVVVIKTTAAGTISVRNLLPGAYEISYATAQRVETNAAEITLKEDASLTANIPAAGVLTVYAKDYLKTVP